MYTVTLDSNGSVQYFGKFRVDIPGSQTGKVGPDTLRDLLNLAHQIGFFEMRDSYSEACTDMPTSIISILVDGKSKRVSNYYGGCEHQKSGPQVDLARLAESIDEAAGTEHWVKCDYQCLTNLIQTGLNANSQSPNGDTPLLIAIQKKDTAKAALLLDAGANVELADQQGMTPLMWAVAGGQVPIVRELLRRGAEVNRKDSKGFTALQMTGDQNTRQLLMASGAECRQALFQDPFLNKGQKRLMSNLQQADLIFVGTVIQVGPPPQFRSGGFMALQAVRYRIQEVVKGVLPSGTNELTVQHVVVGGSRTADPSPEANRLSPSIFAPGSHLVVIAKRESSMWVGSDEDYGVISATASNVIAIKELLNRFNEKQGVRDFIQNPTTVCLTFGVHSTG